MPITYLRKLPKPDKFFCMMEYVLCKTSAINNNESLKLTIHHTALVILQHNNIYHGFLNSCPHMKIPLDWDNNQFFNTDYDLIQCSTHGALFLIHTGECVYGPCLGQHLTKIQLSIRGESIYWTDAPS